MDLSLRSKRLAKLMYQKLILGLSGGIFFKTNKVNVYKKDIINTYNRM